jgi:soluble lytic murein transglycosylase-like protein
MTKIQSYVFPAALFMCLLLVWFGTTAARNLPSASQKAPVVMGQPAPTEIAVKVESPISENNPAVQTQPKGGDNTCPLSQRYPEGILQWCSLIQKYAAENELPAELIAAVMLQESGGDPQAYSYSGAVGLMQVMPKDGIAASFQCINGPCFASRPSIAELQDPEFNISFGTRMLAGLAHNYGSFRDGLRYYGPAGVEYTYADKVLAIFESYR